MDTEKYPNLAAANLIYFNRAGDLVFNEFKFFSQLSYAEVLDYDFNYDEKNVTIDDVESYLANR
jgi:hypothetical protein